MDIGRAVFLGIGIGSIGNALSALNHVHRQHEIVEQSLVGHLSAKGGVYGIEFAGSSHGGIELAVPALQCTFVFPVETFALGGHLTGFSSCHALFSRDTTDGGVGKQTGYLP